MRASRAPVIFVHGAFCGAWAFEAFAKPFAAAGHPTFALDLPGHGPHADPGRLSGLSLTDYAAAVCEAARGLETPPVLVGHSMGGLIAQLTASRVRTSALVLLAPSAPWGVAVSTPEELMCAFGTVAITLGSSVVAPHLGPASRWMLSGLTRMERRAVEARLQSESGRALFETLAWGLDPFAASLVPTGRVGVPVLGFAGAQDLLHPPATVRATVSRLGGETRIVEAGHWLIGQSGWEAIAAQTLQWLAELPMQAAAA